MKELQVYGLRFPVVRVGDNLHSIIHEVLTASGIGIRGGDIIVLAHKIVSLSEGRIIRLDTIRPSQKAIQLASDTGRDAYFCQVVIDNSRRVLYTNGRAIITEDYLGFINTSAGLDRSNSGSAEGELVVLLPENPDRSARKIREYILDRFKCDIGVIISDSFGRPFRKGSVGMAIGVAGINPLLIKDANDIFGRQIHVEEALADDLAATASILTGQTDERTPAVLIRGVEYRRSTTSAIKDILRDPEEDLPFLA